MNNSLITQLQELIADLRCDCTKGMMFYSDDDYVRWNGIQDGREEAADRLQVIVDTYITDEHDETNVD